MHGGVALADIKKGLEPLVGSKIKLRANKGRKKIVEREGVLEGIYPNLFVIKLDESPSRRITFNYSDLLTRTIQLQIFQLDGSFASWEISA